MATSRRKQIRQKSLQNGYRALNRWHNIPHGELCIEKPGDFFIASNRKPKTVVFLGIRKGRLKVLDIENSEVYKVSPYMVVPKKVFDRTKR